MKQRDYFIPFSTGQSSGKCCPPASVMAWSPLLAKGMLTGKYRKGGEQPDSLRAKYFPKAMTDETSLDAVEQLIPLAESAGLSLIHMALAFVVTHHE